MDNYEIIRIPLSGSVSVYVIKSTDGVILVDTGFPGEAETIIQKLHTLNIKMSDIRLIILTHAHLDHYGSAYELKKLLRIPVAVHQDDADVLITGIDYPFSPLKFEGKLLSWFVRSKHEKLKPKAIPFRPDILLDEGSDLSFYGFQGQIVHTPGETPGSISLFMPKGDVIVGDLLASSIPLGRPDYSFFPQDLKQIKQSIAKLLSMHPTLIYSGHAKPINVNEQIRRLHELAGK